jgi:hypothetical protein
LAGTAAASGRDATGRKKGRMKRAGNIGDRFGLVRIRARR